MNSQKIALFGNGNETTQRIATEALRRGHNVTVIVPDEKAFTIKHSNLKVLKGDARRKEDISKFAKGHDVVISAYETNQVKPREDIEITRAFIEGAKASGAQHLLSVAHSFGQPTEKTEEAYNEFKPIVKTQQEVLKLLQNEHQLRWGYVHSIEPEAEEGTGKYHTSNIILFSKPEGQSRIPLKGFASAIIDEVEKNEVELHPYGEEEIEY